MIKLWNVTSILIQMMESQLSVQDLFRLNGHFSINMKEMNSINRFRGTVLKETPGFYQVKVNNECY